MAGKTSNLKGSVGAGAVLWSLWLVAGCGGTARDGYAESGDQGSSGGSGSSGAGGAPGAGAIPGSGGAAGSAGSGGRPPSAFGKPGWRESTAPFCSDRQGVVQGVKVWSDEESVFALSVSAGCDSDGWGCEFLGRSLYSNSGSGWTRMYVDDGAERTELQQGLKGFPGGPLVIHGGPCPVSLVTREGEFRCVVPGDAPGARGVVATSVGSADTGHALLPGGRVLQFDAAGWGEVADLGLIDESRLWRTLSATGDSVYVAGDGAHAAHVSQNGSITRFEDLPPGDYESLWAVDDSDIWLTKRNHGLVHREGNRWREIGMPTGVSIPTELWVSRSGTAYFIGRASFGRVREGKLEILFDLTDPETGSEAVLFTSIWGNSDNEVFVGFQDLSQAGGACGGGSVAFFDGTDLHVF